MNIQEVVNDTRGRAETVGKQYREALAAYVDMHRKAFSVVTRGSQTLASTEIDAAGNVFAAARANFDQARKDGARKVANEPKTYVPFETTDEIVCAYKDTVDLMAETGNELTAIVSDGYKTILDSHKAILNTLTGNPEAATQAPARKQSAGTGKGDASAGSAASARPASSNRAESAGRKTTTRRKASAAASRTSAASATKSAAKSGASQGAGSQKKATQSKGTQSKPTRTGTAQGKASASKAKPDDAAQEQAQAKTDGSTAAE